MAVTARGETVEHVEHELRGAFNHKEASQSAQACLGWGPQMLWRANPWHFTWMFYLYMSFEILNTAADVSWSYLRAKYAAWWVLRVAGSSGNIRVLRCPSQLRIVFLSWAPAGIAAHITGWGKETPEWGGCCVGDAECPHESLIGAW